MEYTAVRGEGCPAWLEGPFIKSPPYQLAPNIETSPDTHSGLVNLSATKTAASDTTV